MRENDGAHYVISLGGRINSSLLDLIPAYCNVRLRFVDNSTMHSDTCSFQRALLDFGRVDSSPTLQLAGPDTDVLMPNRLSSHCCRCWCCISISPVRQLLKLLLMHFERQPAVICSSCWCIELVSLVITVVSLIHQTSSAGGLPVESVRSLDAREAVSCTSRWCCDVW